MTRPRLILHIGPPKTGSTALQSTLLANRAGLQRHGIDYPPVGLREYGHHGIASWLRGQPHPAGVTPGSLAALAHAGTDIILSSENFIYCSREQLQHLAQLLAGFTIEVAMFVRSPAGQWPSHWQELVKHGSEETLIEYIGSCLGLSEHGYARFMDPLYQARLFAGVFGRAQLRLLSYDTLMATGADITEVFLHHLLGIPSFAPPTPTHNAAMTPDITELLRCLNESWHAAHGTAPADRFSAAYQSNRPALDAHPLLPAFSAAFRAHALTLRLDPAQPVLRQAEDQLLGDFGTQLINPNAAGRLFSPAAPHLLPYGPRYWPDRFGIRDIVNQMMHALVMT